MNNRHAPGDGHQSTITTYQRKDGLWSATAKVVGPQGQKVTLRESGLETEDSARAAVNREVDDLVSGLKWGQEMEP